MKELRIVFMGTPDFAVESLKKLIDSGHNIVGVITSKDKQAGRGLKTQKSAVKKYASDQNLKILQPGNFKYPVFIDELKLLNANLFVVVAFRMLPEIVWQMPEFGTINLHASLLPHYRGAAPINWAIINGENKTGVTTFFIEKEIDTGNIILQDEVQILPDETAGELHDKLMITGAELLVKTVKSIADRTVKAMTQLELMTANEIKSAPKIYKDICKINWNNTTGNIHNFIRGLSPYPCAWTEITNGEKSFLLKVFKSRIIPGSPQEESKIYSENNNQLLVGVKDGMIEILELQLQGKKRMKTTDFLRGFNFSDFQLKLD